MRLALGAMALGLMALEVLALVVWTGPAAAEDNPACAKFENPLAYNACLAKLGPKAGATRASAAPAYEGPRSVGASRGFVTMSRGRRGRMTAVFSVAPGRK